MSRVEHTPRSMMEAGTSAEKNVVVCRNCGGTGVHRSRAKTPWEKRLRKYLPVRHWRCHDCQYRILLVDWPRVREIALQIAFWIVAGVAAWWILRLLN